MIRHKVSSIQKATVGNRKVKVFQLWELEEEAGASMWLYSGQHTAPVRTANRDLVAHALRTRDA